MDTLLARAFRTFGLVTIAAVYLLILVGGIVRASGAGMGCPDWPKCFGRWIPPTHVSQLPENYQEIYAHRGYSDTEFNAVKTWTEYINRLLGVAVGLTIFVTLVLSLAFWRTDRPVVVASLLSFLLVGFNGWLGSVVVATNLAPVIITLHMVAALLTVGALIYAVTRSRRDVSRYGSVRPSGWIPLLIAVGLALSFIQYVLGTQVREQVDELMKTLGESARAQWANEFGITFSVHRTFSLVVLAANVALAFVITSRSDHSGTLARAAQALVALIVAEIVVGALLYYAGMPAVLQPLHLLLGALMFGTQLYLAIAYQYARPRSNPLLEPSPTAPGP